MANLRELKKEIDNQIYGVISDCFAYSEIHPSGKRDEVTVIINEAVDLRNNLISRVNNTGSFADAKQVKAHINTVKADLAAGTDKLFTKLSSVSTKKKK